MSKIIHKLFNTKALSVDDEAKSVKFVISTNQEDRYGEVVDQKSWDFKSYLNNPLVLWGHDPSEPENVLGTGASLETEPDGSKTYAVLTFATDINKKAALVFDLIKRGVLRTVSVGFINHTFNTEEDTPVLKDNELLEISVVPIPANSGAVALDLKSGEINGKDAKWLMDSMRKEADLMEVQYKASQSTKKEKSMTDEQAAALIEAVGKLTTTVEEQGKQIEALKPAEETEAEKTAREAKEAEAKAAADKAEADKKAAEEAEAKRIAEEKEAKEKEDLAKSGDDDQDGAKETDNDFDEDTELTLEQEAELAAAIADTVTSQ